MFWSHRYSCYIDCHGGDDELKSKLQEEERLTRQSTESCSVAILPTSSSNELETNLVHNRIKVFIFNFRNNHMLNHLLLSRPRMKWSKNPISLS